MDLPESEVKKILEVGSYSEASDLAGQFDHHLRAIEDAFGVNVLMRDAGLVFTGSDAAVSSAMAVAERLLRSIRSGRVPSDQDADYAVQMVKDGEGKGLEGLDDEAILVTHRGKRLHPKTLGQQRYVEAMRRSDLVFGIGPAGTGKTYLAVAMAVAAYRQRSVSRIVLTRPAVEAGERLGFLPGDLQDKVNPYLRPLYDGLFDTLGIDTFEKYMNRGVIEVAPLAYMRGRTLDDSFIILDEAQNTTSEQMKMMLTRLGLGSQLVVTGDITQIDLPRGRSSGLEEARVVLKGVDGVEFVYLTERDVVRHELVSRVVTAYERFTQKQEPVESGQGGGQG